LKRKRCSARGLAALAVAVAAAWLPGTVPAEPGVTVRAADLRQAPASDAKAVASLPAQAAIDIVKREGAWVQVKSGNATGWLRLFDVRIASAAAGTAPAKAGSGTSLSDTLALATGARSTTATTGVRGLDEEMLRKATPNASELAALDGFAVPPAEAQSFASQGKLVSRTLELLKPTGGK
jgi:hypothetical protein